MFILLVHIPVGQSVIVAAFFIGPIHDQNFQSTVRKYVGLFHISVTYLYNIVFLQSLPGFLKACKKLIKYDLRFGVKRFFTLRAISLILMFTTAWLVESMLGIFSIGHYTIYFLQIDPVVMKQFLKYSWLFGESELGFIIHTKLSSLLFGFHFFVCHFGGGFALQYIFTLSFAVGQRLVEIEDTLVSAIKSHRNAHKVGTNKNSNLIRPDSVSIKAIDVENLISQITEVIEYFESFRNASNGVLLVHMSCTFLSVTLLIYCVFSFVGFWDNEKLFLIAMVQVIYLATGLLKLLWLTSCGESVIRKVSCYLQ